jgi:hypothetical protein
MANCVAYNTTGHIMSVNSLRHAQLVESLTVIGSSQLRSNLAHKY